MRVIIFLRARCSAGYADSGRLFGKPETIQKRASTKLAGFKNMGGDRNARRLATMENFNSVTAREASRQVRSRSR